MDDMLKEHHENWLKYIKSELKASGFDKSKFGEKMLEYLTEMYIISEGRINVMEQLHEVTGRLMDNIPITAITEDDFELVDVKDGYNIVVVSVCKKFPYIYRSPQDGKYYNDRAICFVDVNGNKMYMSNGQYRSTQEITLPYYVNEKIVNI